VYPVSVDGPTFTILGAGGFIGAAVAAHLKSRGHVVHPVTRAALPALLAGRRPAGHVIDCIGLTSNYRNRPLDTADAHVGLVARCLANLRFDSFLLLSSTRVYSRVENAHEDMPLTAVPADPSDVYNVTKLAGEALCLSDLRPSCRVVRLSNVYGIGMSGETFLGEVLREGEASGSVLFRQSPASAKDYVNLAAVVRLLPEIGLRGRSRLYNLAAGNNTSHAAIAFRLREVTGWHTGFARDAPTVRQPPINTARLEGEFGPTASNLIADLPMLLAPGQESRCLPSMRPMAA
jgi:nucleoside-diphosphate-sugar epimerase